MIVWVLTCKYCRREFEAPRKRHRAPTYCGDECRRAVRAERDRLRYLRKIPHPYRFVELPMSDPRVMG